MNIAVIAHTHHPIKSPYAGGLEKHTHMLCEQLAKEGHVVTLFAKAGSREDGYRVHPMVPENFSFHPQPSYSLAWSRQESVVKAFFQSALDEIDNGNFDAVINNSLNVAPLEWEPKIPVLNLLHTPVLPLLKSAARLAGVHPMKSFATVSMANAEPWMELVQNVNVVYNGVDIKPSVGLKRDDSLRWAARITPEKGLHDAIAAARITGRRLEIAGPVSNVDYFNEVIRPLLGNDVNYQGHLVHSDLAEFYGTGAVTLATPMWEEPFGLVVAESLVCGTPVAAYPRGAMPELVTTDVGAVASTSTPEALATAISIAVTKDSDVCMEFGTERFSVETMVSGYMDLIEAMQSQSSLALG